MLNFGRLKLFEIILFCFNLEFLILKIFKRLLHSYKKYLEQYINSAEKLFSYVTITYALDGD